MKTITQIVSDQIGAIYDLRTEYYNLKKEMDKLDTSVQEQAQDWNKLYYEQLTPIKKNFKRSVTELATLLGFSVNEGWFKPSFENYEKILSRLTVRWAGSQMRLHTIDYSDKEFLDDSDFWNEKSNRKH